MYFCPCSCSKPDAENEEDVLIYLPRNLSYAGESYLDRYSVSSAFVHNAKLDKQLLTKDVGGHYLKTGAATRAELLRLEQRGESEKKEGDLASRDCEDSEREELLGARAMAEPGSTCTANGDATRAMSFRSGGGPDDCDVSGETTMSLPESPALSLPTSPSPFRTPLSVNLDGQEKECPHHGHQEGRARQQPDFERYLQKVESPDSDMVSEEGVFVNMMDDLDGIEGGNGKSTISEASDDTYVSGDSMYYSPEEVEGMESEEELRMSLEEAVNKAASSFRSHRHRHHHHHHHHDDDDERDPSVAQDSETARDGEEDDGQEEEEERQEVPEGEPEAQVVFYASDDVEDEKKTTDSAEDSQEKERSGDSTSLDDSPELKSEEPGVGDSESKPEEAGGSRPADSQSKSEESGSTQDDSGSASGSAKAASTDSSAGSQEQGASQSASGAKPKTGDTRNVQNVSGLKITLNDRPFRPDERGLSSSYRDLVSPESPLYEDREFNFARSELRKSTSLKSSKTPPGTPRRKKVVRFADAMGLDLESVRHILNLESPPKIPASAMKDLQAGLGEDRKDMGTKFIVETFQQPGADLGFRERVVNEKVALENALIVSGSITGVVRVANISYHKSVRVRYTTNGWATFHDIAASYMVNSNDGGTDRFSFTIVPPLEFGPGSRLEFAVSFSANGTEFWDNNRGGNYVFECFAKTVPTEAENAWMHFL